MSDLATRIESLSPAKRRLLQQRLKSRGVDNGQKIPKRSGAGSYPLSFSQERMWVLDQLEPNSPLYNNTGAARISGPLHTGALEKSVAEIIKRHNVLRTAFRSVDGRAIQTVVPSMPFSMPVIDLTDLPESDREAAAFRLAEEEGKQPFDLKSLPLMRMTLLRLGDEDHIAVLVMHHIISDGWSLVAFFREMAALYEAYSMEQPPSLPDLPIQYADYALWQREWLQGERLTQQLDYWRQKLANLSALNLPTDRIRPAVPTFRGAVESLPFSAELTGAIRRLSQQENVTMFVFLLTAFNVLLSRYTNQRDITVGSPIAGRDQTEAEPLVGCFINTLVLRSDLSNNPTFAQLLAHVRDVVIEAQSNKDVPFERLVEELQPQRDLSRNPLFQVCFNFNQSLQTALKLSRLTLDFIDFSSGTAKFDMAFDVIDMEQGLRTAFEYSEDLFDAGTVRQMLRHYHALLEAVVANPDQYIDDLPILSEAEQHQLLVEWNTPQAEKIEGQCIQHLFEAQVQRTPQATAIVFEGQQLTYAELNRRADQLAGYLRAKGVGPEITVGVSVNRSPDMIIALLGVLKAGGVYVPLDPEYPSDRLAFMQQDAGISILLAQRHLLDRMSDWSAAVRTAICLDDELLSAGSEATPSNANLHPDDLAYIIYTSGSTGKPKGVSISHAAAVNHFQAIIKHFALTPADRVLQFAPMNFDVSIEQMLPTLLTGATLVLRGDEVWGAAEFFENLAELRLTVVNLPTAYWHQLTREYSAQAGPHGFEHLRLMIIGGDTILPEPVHLWQRMPTESVRLLNAYGPTEVSITSTFFDIPVLSDDGHASVSIPIGRAIGDRTAYVLDHQRRLVPNGVAGELYLGGSLLARGYLNRPDLTAETFVPNPYTDKAGERLYRTGDLARFLPDGNIEFLGRIDHQVKIRGFRIELGEIEAALLRHREIKEAVVIASAGASSDKSLMAYLVPKNATGPAFNELRSFLKEQLPDYMIPASFALLAALPLTPSGKVDRKALPLLNAEHLDSGKAYVAPEGDVEKRLAQIWAGVLDLERVGRHDNFFELGGDSIQCIQVVARANEAGFTLTPKHLFNHQTIAELATVVGPVVAAQSEDPPLVMAASGSGRNGTAQGAYTPEDFPLAKLDSKKLNTVLSLINKSKA